MVESVLELQDAIQESTTFPSEDLAEVLDEEKCFSLTRPDDTEGDDWCFIRLGGGGNTSPWAAQSHVLPAPPGSTKLIKGIVLHSEARVVEVCVGAHDEYFKTVHGKRLGQYEDTEMCACHVQFDPPRREVLLTLKHTYNVDCVWVFGLHVVTTEETVKCRESKFSGGHLSSVLKDKEVNVSKDAARFLHMLESYNGVNNGSSQLNENNQLALMSMFLGPKMLNNVSLGPGMFDKVDNKDEKNYAVKKRLRTEKDDIPEVKKDLSAASRVTDMDEANCNDVENKMKELKINREESNISKELTSEGNNNTGGNLYKESHRTSKPQTVGNQDGFIEKLFTLMGNTGQQNTQGQRNITKPEASLPPPSPLDCLLRPPAASPHDHNADVMQTLMKSLSRIPTKTNNFHPSHSAAGGGPAHSTPRARVSGNDVWPGDGGCDGLSLEKSGLLLKEIENMIDRKFAQMEERLVKRLEEKVAEKAESDRKKLENIEQHLCRLCEHLQR